jgi:hypothetical protein
MNASSPGRTTCRVGFSCIRGGARVKSMYNISQINMNTTMHSINLKHVYYYSKAVEKSDAVRHESISSLS